MDWDKLKIDFTSKQDQLMNVEYSYFNLKDSCKNLFDDLTYLTYNPKDIDINELIKFTTDNFSLTSTEITDKYDDDLIVKVLAYQAGFFLSFYSFLVSNFSYELSGTIKEEFTAWLFDIVSTLNITMEITDWKIFMQNFILSFHETLSPVLIEIYEMIGLDLPPELSPDGIGVEEEPDESYLSFDIKECTEKSKAKKRHSLIDLKRLESEEKANIRMVFEYGTSLANNRTIKPTRKSLISMKPEKRKSNSKKKEKPESTKRKSLVPETPNYKRISGPRHARAALAAQKKLDGRVIVIKNSPIPNRSTPSTPTMQRKLRRALAKTDNQLRKRSNPISKCDYWVQAQENQERSLTQFSNESHESISFSSIPTTRFQSRLFDAFNSPIKQCDNLDQSNSIDVVNQSIGTPNKQTPKKRCRPFFSPVKAADDKYIDLKSPHKQMKTMSPRRMNLFSPIKSHNRFNLSPSITVIETSSPKTPLKSCLKSPIPAQRKVRKSHVNRHTSQSSSSILLSPKIKQRSFLGSQPAQYFCEDTVYMDTQDFIKSSGYGHEKLYSNLSPLPSYLNNNETGKNVARKSIQKKLFDDLDTNSDNLTSGTATGISTNQISSGNHDNNGIISSTRKKSNLFDHITSDINTENILPTTRRSMIPALNFNNLDPETDNSNSFLV